MFVGPAGSGKLTEARKLLGVCEKPRFRTLEIGDYIARYWEFTTHLEIDVADLSMMDKQILPELLNQLLSTRDVRSLGRGRKIMIVRHIHCLSPPAALRFRVCLEELVWHPDAPAMIWCTTRTVNSAVATIMDGFVYKQVPGPGPAQPENPIQTFLYRIFREMVLTTNRGALTLAAVPWIRARVYDLLGLMVTGNDLVSGFVWATVRLAASGELSSKKAAAVLDVLTRVRWFPSYRTPIIMELIILSVGDALGSA